MKGTVMKYKMEQSAEAPRTLKLYIYDEVEPDGYDWWSGRKVQSETSASYFRDQLAQYQDADRLEIHINSMGGSVIEGYGIYAQLRANKAHKVVYVDGFACSIASVIAMAGDEIVMYRNAMMCVHNMADACYGNAAAHRKCADDLDKIMEGNRQIYLERAGAALAEDKLVEMLEAETWLTAAECKALGWCTEVVNEDADLTGAEDMLAQRAEGLAAQVSKLRALGQLVRQMVGAPEPGEDGGVPPSAAQGAAPPSSEGGGDGSGASGPEQSRAVKLLGALFQ